ncbi:MAG: hypothetical protein EHM41_10880 [Chloroflexi bacterium]|nr:MAG: hypothetical protein EHM41_10880 [Chloroflexota bacterium]
MKYYLGVDVGGTKTHALIACEDGTAVALGEAGTGNHEVVGYGGLRKALTESLTAALSEANLSVEEISGAGFGVGGYDWPSELQPTLNKIETLGLGCQIDIVNDSVIGLVAGATEGWGVVLIAGTGNNVRGRDRTGREGRITGNGGWFGESGGAGELVGKAICAVSHEWTRRGPPTALTQTFLQLTGAKDSEDFIEGLVMERIHPSANWAQAVFQTAQAGDEIAREVIEWTARELGASAVGVIRQLNFQQEIFEVIMVGSLFKGGPLYNEPLKETILNEAPGAKFIRLEAPPVIGGVLLGMEKSGYAGYVYRERMIETTIELLRGKLSP